MAQQQYAKDQPQGFKNHVENIAIVGAGGQVGEYMARALLKTGKHHLTAITRADSKSTVPEGMAVKKVNYDDPATLVDALRGQDVLIITMAVTAPPETETKLLDAAAEAGVPWVLPNEYSSDPRNKALQHDIMIGDAKDARRRHIEELGVSSWISFTCSFWYEYSLSASPGCYGFDFANKTVTLYDDGNTKINTTTWLQCGRAAAALLSLPILPRDPSDKSPTLSMFRNNVMYISSFRVSQRDMLASILRVTGDKEDDWTVHHEDVQERYKAGVDEMKSGSRAGFVKVLYARVFFPNGDGDFESKYGLHNDILGLPREDFDEATKRGVDLAAKGGPWAVRGGAA
ncbi:uncharacterized protein Z520_00340 [Fonsecaea multimorphosa CBS 102226]|uniref:NmrA-like domain-containing protein n=1 Tax=Fonsecaea multimorphosa CBS 102226 TaxID=1442371 RepID=A0A0D2L3N2_9EURO|nr:uncharacterized protein Z520_00340 [Fonsecaea multimorphosa CBS 102226]KIY03649.1 hypothetical protein Z520_00340 [Fonsecaea multimorphosa CBS 102226]OAL32348.1 hypothetical protein AYO22_00370 [Fonsecaea multimorphosa]